MFPNSSSNIIYAITCLVMTCHAIAAEDLLKLPWPSRTCSAAKPMLVPGSVDGDCNKTDTRHSFFVSCFDIYPSNSSGQVHLCHQHITDALISLQWMRPAGPTAHTVQAGYSGVQGPTCSRAILPWSTRPRRWSPWSTSAAFFWLQLSCCAISQTVYSWQSSFPCRCCPTLEQLAWLLAGWFAVDLSAPAETLSVPAVLPRCCIYCKCCQAVLLWHS